MRRTAVIAGEPEFGRNMGARRWVIVAICALLTALDGYDVLSISFAAPAIAKEWNVAPSTLGVVLSMELIGMALGGIVLGLAADRFGRRPILIGALSVVVAGIFCAAMSENIVSLGAFRLATGLGLGGILAIAPTVATEFASQKHRDVATALTSGGYPVGAFLGGIVATQIVASGWHNVFLAGAVATACMLPFVIWLVPETPIFSQLRSNVASATRATRPKAGVAKLFSGNLAQITSLLVIAYLTHVSTVYYMMKWSPMIVADMGFSTAVAGRVLVWNNAGGAIGSILFSILTRYLDPTRWMLATMAIGAMSVIAFGFAPNDLTPLSIIAFLSGFGLSTTIVGFYALLARAFPTEARATGVGFVIGLGRAGSSLSPILAGVLFAGGYGPEAVSVVMASGSIIAILCLLRINSLMHRGKLGIGGAY